MDDFLPSFFIVVGFFPIRLFVFRNFSLSAPQWPLEQDELAQENVQKLPGLDCCIARSILSALSPPYFSDRNANFLRLPPESLAMKYVTPNRESAHGSEFKVPRLVASHRIRLLSLDDDESGDVIPGGELPLHLRHP